MNVRPKPPDDDALASLHLVAMLAVTLVEFHGGDPRLGALLVRRIEERMAVVAPEVAAKLRVVVRMIADLTGAAVSPRHMPN